MKRTAAAPIRMTLTAILLIGMVGVLFSGCDVTGQDSMAAIFSPTPVLSPTSTIVWFPVTSTPELVAMSTTTPNATGGPVYGPLTFDDTGVISEHWVAAQEAAGLVTVSKDSLGLAVNNPRGSLLTLRKDTNLNDFYFETVMTMGLCRNDDAAGVAFRTVDAQNYYVFLVNCQGRIALERVLKGSPAMLSDWSLTNQAQPGLAQPLKIGVWARGSTIRIYLNDQLQYEVINSAYYSGGIGFFAQASGDTSVSANFSEIKNFKAAE
jgi:hypothetical protein